MGNSNSTDGRARNVTGWTAKLNEMVEQEIFEGRATGRGFPRYVEGAPGVPPVLSQAQRLYGLRVQILLKDVGSTSAVGQLHYEREGQLGQVPSGLAIQYYVPLTHVETLWTLPQSLSEDHTGEIFEICPPAIESGPPGSQTFDPATYNTFRLRLAPMHEYDPDQADIGEAFSTVRLPPRRDGQSVTVNAIRIYQPNPGEQDTYVEISGMSAFHAEAFTGSFPRPAFSGIMENVHRVVPVTLRTGPGRANIYYANGVFGASTLQEQPMFAFGFIPVGFNHVDTVVRRSFPLSGSTGTPTPGTFAARFLNDSVLGYEACPGVNDAGFVNTVIQTQCSDITKTPDRVLDLCGAGENWNVFRPECYSLAAALSVPYVGLSDGVAAWCNAPAAAGLATRLPSQCRYRAYCNDPAVAAEEKVVAKCPTTPLPNCTPPQLAASAQYGTAVCSCHDGAGLNQYLAETGLAAFVGVTGIARPECIFADCLSGQDRPVVGEPFTPVTTGAFIKTDGLSACPSSCVQIGTLNANNSVFNGGAVVQQTCCLATDFKDQFDQSNSPDVETVAAVCEFPLPQQEPAPDATLVVALVVALLVVLAAIAAALWLRRKRGAQARASGSADA